MDQEKISSVDVVITAEKKKTEKKKRKQGILVLF